MVKWGHKDHQGLQDQRVSPEILECQGQTVHLDQRVCKVPEDHQAHQGHKEHRVTKDRSAHLASPAPPGDQGGKATQGNLAPRV